MVDSLEEWAEIMYKDIPIIDYPNWYFSKHHKCCYGGQIFEWLIDKVAPEQKRARNYCQQMLDQNIIKNVEGKT